MNLAIRQLEESIYAMLNEIKLPIEVKRLVIKEVYQTVASASEEEIKKEVEEIAESTP